MATYEEIKAGLAPYLDPYQQNQTNADTNAATTAARIIAKGLIDAGINPNDPAFTEALNKIKDPLLREQIQLQMPDVTKALGNPLGISALERLATDRDNSLRQSEITKQSQLSTLGFQRDTTLRDLGVALDQRMRDLGINKERMLRDLLFGHEGALHDLELLKRSIMDDIAGRGLWNSGATPWEQKEADWRLNRENTQYGYGVGDANQNYATGASDAQSAYQRGTSDATQGYNIASANLLAQLAENDRLARQGYDTGANQTIYDALGLIGDTNLGYLNQKGENQAAFNSAAGNLAANPPQALLDALSPPPPPPPPPTTAFVPAGAQEDQSRLGSAAHTVNWGGQQFTQKADLAKWLSSRGANIDTWASAHPDAYKRLR